MNREEYVARWYRAMDNAAQAGVVVWRIGTDTYAASSARQEGGTYTLTLSPDGRIAHCTCKGWEIFAAAREEGMIRTPCKHAGKLARLLLAERGVPMWGAA